MKPHKHEKYIKLKADGVLIERKVSSGWMQAYWSDFSATDLEFRIAPNQPADENCIAELEAQLKHAEGHAAELEAEVKAWREYADRFQQLSLVKWKAAREGK